MPRHTLLAGIALLAFGATSRSETVILKDGSFVEGEITLETSRSLRVETRFGTRTFLRKDVEEVIPGVEIPDPQDAGGFGKLSAPFRAVLNAKADYKLGNYKRALTRLEPFRKQTDNRALRIQMDWLTIEIHERLKRWETARELLEKKRDQGTPRERIRAEAHLEIFHTNPRYDLRFVGEKHARNFIRDEELRNRAREPGALADERIMRAALEEYCEQMLVEDELSVKGFSDRLDPDETYQIIKDLPPAADLAERLPYMADLKKAEASIYKAQSILGDYGVAFETDLVRTELTHLLTVFERLVEEVFQQSPENFQPQADPRSGRLTPQGRQAWQRRCDEFLQSVRPLVALVDYMLDKARRDPRGLRNLNRFLTDFRERLDQTIKAVKRARDRTHV